MSELWHFVSLRIYINISGRGLRTANVSLKIETEYLSETLVTAYQDKEYHFTEDFNLEECTTQK